MPKKITRLTDEQKAKMKPWADKWIASGLSTERADWARFERAARECYRAANLNADVPIIHVSSPMVGAFAAPIAAKIIHELQKRKGSAVRSAVYSAVYSAVGSAVDSAVGSAVRSAKNMFWHYWMGGALWSGWPAFTQFFIEECGLDFGDIGKRANAYAETALSAGYWWPNKDFIMVCDRPTKIAMDSRGRLHCEDGMAITWTDGWGLFMWHGTRVPAKLIMDPAAVTKEDITSEKNSEVSRAYSERLGWKDYFKLVDVQKIDAWNDRKTGLFYELYDFKTRLGDRQPKLLRMESPVVNDGTKPVYIEPVDPGLTTAKAARRWQFRKPDGQFPSVAECNKSPDLAFAWEA